MDHHSARKVTINQVAEYCGVSKTTISRFLNGRYENMSEETKERIAAAINELNYHPDRSAQRLKASKTMLIGCVIGDVSSPFSALLLRGITSVCEEAGFQVLFADSRESAKLEKRAIQGFLDNRVDGLIVNTCGGNDDYLLSLRERGIPTVLADRTLSEPGLMDTVSSANSENASDCVRFLFERGYTRVAFFSETIASITPRLLRRSGYIDGIGKYAPAGTEPEIYEFDGDSRTACADCITAFRSKYPDERIAILSANGTSCRKLLTSLNSLGVKAGYKLGLCTFDDWDWLDIADPGITALALGSVEIGARSARLLLESINGRRDESSPAETVIVPARLTVRGSTPLA